MAEILTIISKISFGLSAVAFVIAVALWFKYKIPKVYGDLSGRTAKRSIEEIRKENESSGKKSFRPSAVNLSRGKITEAMSGALGKKKSSMPGTEKMDVSDVSSSPVTAPTEELEQQTVLLETEVLEVLNETEVLVETELLEETVLLDETEVLVGDNKLRLVDQIIFIHTNEFI